VFPYEYLGVYFSITCVWFRREVEPVWVQYLCQWQWSIKAVSLSSSFHGALIISLLAVEGAVLVPATEVPDSFTQGFPAFPSCDTEAEGGSPDVPEHEGHQPAPCLGAEELTGSLPSPREPLPFFFLHLTRRSTVPCISTRLLGGNPASGWRAAVLTLPGAGTWLLCHGSRAAVEQLAPTQALRWVGKAGTGRQSPLFCGVREGPSPPSLMQKWSWERGGSISQASQSLPPFLPLPPPSPQGKVLRKSETCKREQPWDGAGRPSGTYPGLQTLLGSFSHSVCSFHKILPCLSSFAQLLLLSVLTLETHSLGCVLCEVRVMAGTHPAHQPACLPCLPHSHCITAGCGALLRNHLLTHPSLACLSEIMPSFKNHFAALHDIFIHFFTVVNFFR